MVEDHETELEEVLKEVRHIEVQSDRLVTDVMAGGYTSVFRGPGIEFDEVRDYEVGDDPRSVDWNVTARTGRPFVKKYVDERELTLVFLLDLSPSMLGGFGPWSARQMAARISACLALSAVKSGDKVGLIAFGEKVEKFVPPGKGLAHALRIVRDTLALKAEGTRTKLAPALEYAGRVIRRRAVMFLLSDFMARDWRERLTLCARRHDLIAVRLLAPELAPANAGLTRVRDPETGKEVVIDWSDRRVRDTFAERTAAWHRRVTAALRRAKVDLMDVPLPSRPDPDAVARPILRFFRLRELRGGRR